MKLLSSPSQPCGDVYIPASKSHTIRALLIATLAEGTSVIHSPLESADTAACIDTCRAFGADIQEHNNSLYVKGCNGTPHIPDDVINVGNSGTTLFLALSVAALAAGTTIFTGDYQIRRRSAQPLLDALQLLGATAESTRANGCAPFIVKGPLHGGNVSLECPTSQYLSSILIAAPCAKGTTTISVPLLYEKPYVEMTLDWLADQTISLEYEKDLSYFSIPGGQRYTAYEKAVPGDFSSATFFLVGAAIAGKEIRMHGLDMNDAQGDKAVINMLQKMGASIEEKDNCIHVHPGTLKGCELDLNATPDALPALAIAGCAAQGETHLVNVPQARIKETDRIAVMCKELTALGADCEEREDGLIIRHSALRGGNVMGHDDHRVVMALALAGMIADAPVTIDNAEAMRITFPTYVELWNALGARMECYEDA